ncbi:MAG TPA: PqqD family protein [Thermoanaerobaculia bacterium]|nr:PqqD family protein [Thermoanaerobaculia bacterium]
MQPLALRSILRRRADVRFRVIDREAVVVRQSAAEVVVLNEVAARILTLADGSTSLESWVDVLAAEYEASRETLERDVAGFAAELVEQGLLEVA